MIECQTSLRLYLYQNERNIYVELEISNDERSLNVRLKLQTMGEFFFR